MRIRYAKGGKDGGDFDTEPGDPPTRGFVFDPTGMFVTAVGDDHLDTQSHYPGFSSTQEYYEDLLPMSDGHRVDMLTGSGEPTMQYVDYTGQSRSLKYDPGTLPGLSNGQTGVESLVDVGPSVAVGVPEFHAAAQAYEAQMHFKAV
jgi:hypothetical protein